MIRERIIEVWKKGFVSTKYMTMVETQYTSLPLVSRWILFLHILTFVKQSEEEIRKWHSRFKSIYGFSLTESQMDMVILRLKQRTDIIEFHPWIECFRDSNYYFHEIRQSYPLKISRIITICVQNEEKCMWNILQTIRKRNQIVDISFAGIFLSLIEKWQPMTFQLLLSCLDSYFLRSILPHVYSNGSIPQRNSSIHDTLSSKLSLIPVDSSIKQKWYQNLDSLSSQNSDTLHKYKQYYEHLVSIPFHVYHETSIPTHRLYSLIETFRTKMIPYDTQGRLKETWNRFVSLGMIGKMEYWNDILSICKSILFAWIRQAPKRKQKQIQKRLGGQTDIYSCEPLQLLDTEQKELLTSISSECKKIRNWVREYIQESKDSMNHVIYGMKQPKQFILNEVTNWLNHTDKGIVLGLNGPPGVGKTTFVRNAIAPCFRDENGNSRPVITIGLGGKVSGSSLRGHGFTYVGSKFGSILQGIIQSGCMNPIFYFDELDKVSQTAQGAEIQSILMQITDFSQNHTFEDAYFHDITFDLSKCIFIFSYNDSSSIDPILRNRIQEITLHPISFQEKIHILHTYTIPNVLKRYKLPSSCSSLSKDILSQIVLRYTNEPGIRSAEHIIDYLISKQCYLYYESRSDESLAAIQTNLTADTLSTWLRHLTQIQVELPFQRPQIGHIIGLYATTYGIGGLLALESVFVPNEKEDAISGNVSKVMKESLSIARVVSGWKQDGRSGSLHVHCNEASTPKDGPSAGLALSILYWSHIHQIPIPHTLAATGEITMRGKVDRIGGIIQKIFAAVHYGIQSVLAPKSNQDDWESYLHTLDVSIKKQIESMIRIHWVETLEEATSIIVAKKKKFG